MAYIEYVLGLAEYDELKRIRESLQRGQRPGSKRFREETCSMLDIRFSNKGHGRPKKA